MKLLEPKRQLPAYQPAPTGLPTNQSPAPTGLPTMTKVKTKPAQLSMTPEAIKALPLAQLKNLARDHGVKNWWKLRVDDIRLALEALTIQLESEPSVPELLEPEVTDVTPEVTESAPDEVTEITTEVTESAQDEIIESAPEVEDGLTDLISDLFTDLNDSQVSTITEVITEMFESEKPEMTVQLVIDNETVTKLAPAPSEVTESAPSANGYRHISLDEFTDILKDNLQDLTEAELAQLQASWSITDARCKTPNVTVVKRSALIKFLNARIRHLVRADEFCDHELTEPVFNQVVSMVSNSLPRQVMTIKGASRFKYLLPHVGVSVMVWTLENLHRISEAIERAESAQNQGYSSPRDTRESRGLEPKVTRQ